MLVSNTKDCGYVILTLVDAFPALLVCGIRPGDIQAQSVHFHSAKGATSTTAAHEDDTHVLREK